MCSCAYNGIELFEGLMISSGKLKSESKIHSFSSHVLQSLLLPALQGLRMMWNKKWEMVLPAAGVHIGMKLGNAWKNFSRASASALT